MGKRSLCLMPLAVCCLLLSALSTFLDAQESLAQPPQSDFSTSFYLLSRQQYETKKANELTNLLEQVLGKDNVGVHVQFEWPPLGSGAGMDALTPTRISVLVVAQGAPDASDVEFVRTLAGRVLGLVPERGDQVNVYSMKRNRGVRELLFSPGSVLELVKFFVMILIALIILATLSRSASKISGTLERAATVRAADQGIMVEARGPSAISGSMQAKLAVMTIPGDSGFSQADPELLARILQEESSRNIAVFISVLESDMAGKVLSSLPPSKQEEVAMTIPQMAEPDPREAAQLQAQIHLKLRKSAVEKK